ncbi:hypothetical protein [Tsuneonella mangrovi]|uniref:hypothetical protein n=1 Tax=Tsuneonella mangrovi TaxID=1982042 RepID=UPI000BA1E0EE|nr:hypothetical protein [Tsuneonella mangrovi]
MSNSNKIVRGLMTSCLIVSATALGGCQSIFGFGGHTASALPRIDQPLPDDYGAIQLAAARKALSEGRTSDAIDGFMVARLYPASAAAAYNGLAVAYSRIGRTDLTERFFTKAVALAPQDDRYRANLALFYSRNGSVKSDLPAALAVQQAADEASRAAQADQAPAEASPVAVAVAERPTVVHFADGITAREPQGRMHRVSRREVTITTPTESKPDDAVAVYSPRPAVFAIRTGTNARRAAPPYPIRIALTSPDKAEAVEPARQAYPIRIDLKD